MAMKRLSTLAALLALLLGGCRAGVQQTSRPPTQPSTSPPPAASPTTTSATPISTECQVPDGQPHGLLAAIHSEPHADHDRVVFQFDGPVAPSAHIRYVDRVTADPSDQPVPLLGSAIVDIAFSGARLDTAPIESDPSQVRRYTGPTRLTPGYPLLQELAVIGDFEAVLSVGLGLSAVAGLTVSTPKNRGCVILDLWREAPKTLLWPITSVAQAQAVQQATQDGHQPWTLDAQQVATSYAHHVLGWQHARVERLTKHVFQATTGAQAAVITLTQPLNRPGTVWAVASVIQ
jgi:hypothetical protein